MAERKIHTVSELNARVRSAIEAGLTSVWVEGEISNLRIYQSGHAYFTLKDKSSQVRGVMWKGRVALLRFTPKDGDQVVVRGRVSVYEPRGEYQVVADSMEPAGLGALQAAFEQLKKKLEDEGLFDKKHKKPIPLIAWTVGIVTSPKGAVIRDMIRTIYRRFPGIHIIFAPAKVQGKGSAQEIVQAIADLNEHGQADVIIVGRGGGSLEDLWEFNEETVARAIFASKIPVISAVGHETDFTIADFVADLRASTPTSAAEQVAPRREDLEVTIDSLNARAESILRNKLETMSQKVDETDGRIQRAVISGLSHVREKTKGVIRHLGALHPKEKIKREKENLSTLTNSMARSLLHLSETKKQEAVTLTNRLSAIRPKRWIKERTELVNRHRADLHNASKTIVLNLKNHVKIVEGRLASINPLAVLERGYSIVTSADGKKVYKSINDLTAGTKIKVRVADGETAATVDGNRQNRQEKLFD